MHLPLVFALPQLTSQTVPAGTKTRRSRGATRQQNGQLACVYNTLSCGCIFDGCRLWGEGNGQECASGERMDFMHASANTTQSKNFHLSSDSFMQSNATFVYSPVNEVLPTSTYVPTYRVSRMERKLLYDSTYVRT